MTTRLYQLGTFAFRRRKFVALAWIAAVGMIVTASMAWSGEPTERLEVPGAEAEAAIEVLQREFPESAAAGATARVVFTTDDDEATLSDPDVAAAVSDLMRRLKAAPQVASVSDLGERSISPDGRIGFIEVTYEVKAGDLDEATRAGLAAAVESGRDAGLTVEVGGDAVDEAPEFGNAEAVGVAVAAIVLIVTFGSMIAAGLSLLTALLGVTLGFAGIGLAAALVEMPSAVNMLALMLGLAVGIDYALFITSRYRSELAAGRDPEDAAGRAIATAGAAVIFAGTTVVIALVGLVVVDLPFLTAIGLASASVVAVAVSIALTLLPATFGFAGRRILGRRDRRPAGQGRDAADRGARPTLGRRWVELVLRRPTAFLVATVALLAIAAVPALDMRLGLSDDGMAPADSSPRRAFDLLSDGFGPGHNGPLTVVVSDADAARVAGTVSQLDHVVSVSPVRASISGNVSVFSVTPEEGPNDATTVDLVNAIRSDSDIGGTGEVLVTGRTATNIDASADIADSLLLYLGSIVGLAFLLLVLVFRSILVPIKATLGFLLTTGATFGVMVAVFQWGWAGSLVGLSTTSPIISLMPIFITGILFGLAMDYEVFLVSRMREAFDLGATPRDAIVEGFSASARVVTAAAVIMVSIFCGFMFAPDLSIKMPGLGLATAIFVDAFLVRMTIVPAAMALLGRAAWWLPARLDDALPHRGVEGRGIAGHPTVAGVPVREPVG